MSDKEEEKVESKFIPMTEEEKKASRKESNRLYKKRHPATCRKARHKYNNGTRKELMKERKQLHDDYLAGKLIYKN